MNGSNDRFLLDERLATRHKAQAAGVELDAFFNVFVAELVTQDYQLPGPEYLQYGVVDGPQDCGVDAIYTFVNGTLVTDDFRRFQVPQEPQLDLHVLQCKTSGTFTEQPVEKLVTHLPVILDLERSEGDLARICNAALLAESRRFLDTYSSLGAKRPKLAITVHYAARASTPSDGVRAKAAMVEEKLASYFREATVSFNLLGCRELVDLARRPARVSRDLRLADSPLASENGDGYACLVRLSDYYEFIRDPETGRLDAALFEANVREHEGETEVNSEILESLQDRSGSFDFWWLNNGVTVVAEDVRSMGKRLMLDSPQVVNGLQTSTEVFKYFNSANQEDDRLLLARVVRAADAGLRDKIVKATNSQNELPLSALRATEPFQRDIEDFLAARGYFYDRRRNYSRTRGYDDKRVVSMNFVGHAVNSVLKQRPHLSRSEGAALLNDDSLYSDLFEPSLPLNLYLKCIWLLRMVQSAITNDVRVKGTSVEDWQYHVAAVAAMLLTRKSEPTPADVAGMNLEELSEERLVDVVEIVAVEFQSAIPTTGSWTFREIAESPRTARAVRDRASSLLKSQHWRVWPYEEVDPQYAIRASDVFYKRLTGDRR